MLRPHSTEFMSIRNRVVAVSVQESVADAGHVEVVVAAFVADPRVKGAEAVVDGILVAHRGKGRHRRIRPDVLRLREYDDRADGLRIDRRDIFRRAREVLDRWIRARLIGRWRESRRHGSAYGQDQSGKNEF